MKSFLSAQETSVLKEAHRACRIKRHADRIKTVLLLNQGYKYTKIAKILLLDDTTLRTYFCRYKDGGLDAIIEDHYQGKQGRLTRKQERQLSQHLESCIYQTVKQIVAYIKEEYGVVYTVEGVTRLLHRLGFVYKKTKRVPGKINLQAQKEFIKEYKQIKQTKKPEDKIYFVDASHPLHNSKPAYGWIKKGKIKELKANTGRKRINLNGALNLENLRVIVQEKQTINADAMIAICKQIEREQPKGLIYLILDNARYNRAKKLGKYVKKTKRIILVYLPPYCPNLNFFERLTTDYRQDMQTLLTDNFQVIGAQSHGF